MKSNQKKPESDRRKWIVATEKYTTDKKSAIDNLEVTSPLRMPILSDIVQALHLSPGSRGLDIGCGTGLACELLAQATQPDGKIIGFDIAQDILSYARRKLDSQGLAEQVAFVRGDMYCLPFEDGAFDYAWSADCIGYPAGEWLPLLQETRRVVKPGGKVVILAWTSQQLLPGHALLEARLNATCSAYIPYLSAQPPEAHFLRAADWLRKAGLQEISVQSFIGNVVGPISEPHQRAIHALVEMLWSAPQAGASSADWDELCRLHRPGSPDDILNLPGYYAFFTYTVFSGKAPGEAEQA